MRDDVSCPHVSELICFSGDSSKKKKGSSVVSSSRKRNSTCKYVDYPTKESTLTCARTWARGRERERGRRKGDIETTTAKVASSVPSVESG